MVVAFSTFNTLLKPSSQFYLDFILLLREWRSYLRRMFSRQLPPDLQTDQCPRQPSLPSPTRWKVVSLLPCTLSPPLLCSWSPLCPLPHSLLSLQPLSPGSLSKTKPALGPRCPAAPSSLLLAFTTVLLETEVCTFYPDFLPPTHLTSYDPVSAPPPHSSHPALAGRTYNSFVTKPRGCFQSQWVQ